MRDYYILIPSFILQHPGLKQVDSIVYGHIKRYVDMRQCFASNAHLAAEIRISTRCFGASLQRLEKNKIITRKIHYKKGTKQVIKRVISFVHNSTSTESIDSKELSPKIVDKLGGPPAKVAYTPPAKVAYISIKNKSIQKKERKEKKESLAAANSGAAQTALSIKKPKAVSKSSNAVKASNVDVTTDNSIKRSHSSTDAPTQPELLSLKDVKAQITIVEENIATAQTNYIRALQSKNLIQIKRSERTLKNSELMLKRLLN